MIADDPRHGTYASSVAGCACDPCRAANARYERGRSWDVLRGAPRTVSIVGFRRRAQALQALGWSAEELSTRLGHSSSWIRVTLLNKSGQIYARNHDAMAALYNELSMTLPTETRHTARLRAAARHKGFAPPLAWDNIDDPNEIPRGYRTSRPLMTDVDPVAVERAMAGDRIQLTRDERYEVVARLRGMGRSLRWIEEHTVITKAERYLARGDAA